MYQINSIKKGDLYIHFTIDLPSQLDYEKSEKKKIIKLLTKIIMIKGI